MSRNDDEVLPPYGYRRGQFLSDVTWMGLGPEQAFSRKNLRRQRDQLMHIHHPDRGGSAEMAVRINLTYSRMIGWLDRHLERRGYLRMRREQVLAREAAKTAATPLKTTGHNIGTTRLYAVIFGTAAAVAALGVSSLIRRRR